MAAEHRELRVFAATFAGTFGVIAGVIVPALRHRPLPVWPWAVGAIVLLIALLAPRSLGPAHTLTRAVIDRVTIIQSRVVLTIVYLLIILPLGLMLQASRRLRRERPDERTYRLPSEQRTKASLEKPF
jgi:hypothetical protein